MQGTFPNNYGPAAGSPQPGSFAKTVFVGSSGLGYRSSADGYDYEKPIPTLGISATGRVDGALRDGVVDNADRGTLIVMRKGSTENISVANNFSLLGTRKRIYLQGEGDETERPTLTFSLAGATWLLANDSIILDNFNINLEPGAGGVVVAAPFTISGNGCGFRRCKFRVGTDGANKVTVGLTWTGKDGFMEDCILNGATAATCTTVLRLTGADRFRAFRTRIDAATTAVGVGVVQYLTTASLNQDWRECFFRNNLAASTQAVGSLAGNTGAMHSCNAGILAGSTATAIDHTAGSMNYYNCRISLALGAVDAAMT